VVQSDDAAEPYLTTAAAGEPAAPHALDGLVAAVAALAPARTVGTGAARAATVELVLRAQLAPAHGPRCVELAVANRPVRRFWRLSALLAHKKAT
jgi:hypothetical protein